MSGNMERKLFTVFDVAIALLGVMCLPMQAHAAFGDYMCDLADVILHMEPVVGTLLMIKMGIMALYGRLTWNLAVLHFVGMGAIVGAGAIVTLMTGVAACP